MTREQADRLLNALDEQAARTAAAQAGARGHEKHGGTGDGTSARAAHGVLAIGLLAGARASADATLAVRLDRNPIRPANRRRWRW